MIVVCDASPLITLLNVGRLDLLRDLYGQVLIPSAVRSEILALGPIDRFPPPWIEVRDPADAAPAATVGLGAGETAALTLARALGLRAVGLLKILLDAEAAGLIPHVRPLLDEVAAAKFRVSAPLRAEVLRRAGETETDAL